MDTQKAFLVIGITLIVVIVFNAIIISLSKKGRSTSVQQVKMLTGLVKNARDPMKEDKAKLEELSRLMKEIQAEEMDNNPDKAES